MSYATVAQLRAYLPQAKTGVPEDALMQSILDRANAIVDEALGFSFAAWGASATARDVECRHWGRWLELPYHKPASVTEVSAVSGRGTSGESTELLSDWIEESDGRLYMDDGHGADWYRVTAIWGYGPSPASVVEIELRIARTLWRNRDAAIGQGSIGVDGQGAVDARSLSWDERNIIEGVRHRYLGVVHA